MKQQMHTPEGVRDIYGVEYKKKLIIEEKLQRVMHLYGYQDIQTPMFEYFDVFGKEVGTIPSKELYKFFDKDYNITGVYQHHRQCDKIHLVGRSHQRRCKRG